MSIHYNYSLANTLDYLDALLHGTPNGKAPKLVKLIPQLTKKKTLAVSAPSSTAERNKQNHNHH